MALAHARHPQYAVAAEWIDSVPDKDVVYFCRLTKLSLLRLLTTPSAMGEDVMTQAAAWGVYDLFMQDNRMAFADEPRQFEQEFRRKTNRRETSAKQWADGYVAAFAEVGGFRLVTFDKAVAKASAGSRFLGSRRS